MKKVYTITFHNANNYGAVLQAYALQKVLKCKYESYVLDYENAEVAGGRRIFNFFNEGRINLLQLFKDILNHKKNVTRNNYFDEFLQQLSVSKNISCVADLPFLEADAFVVGSDQVWNPGLTGGIDDIYLLNMNLAPAKKIAYAASAGDARVLEDHETIFEAINHFDHVSVRENSLKCLLDRNTNVGACVVLDPSLLLGKEDWSRFAGEEPILKGKYLLVYCGDEPDAFYDIANSYCEQKGAYIVHFGRRDRKRKFKCKKKSMYEVGPREFVNLIKFSEGVVTASFHGTALGIALNKDILIYLNKYSDRLKTLANMCQIEDRIVNSSEDLQNIKEIDWDNVNAILEVKREESVRWLYNAIGE